MPVTASQQPGNHNYIVLGLTKTTDDQPRQHVYHVSDFYRSEDSPKSVAALIHWTESNGVEVDLILERQLDGSFKPVYAPNLFNGDGQLVQIMPEPIPLNPEEDTEEI